MHRRIALRLKQAGLKAARPAQRAVMRALRHHAARARRLAPEIARAVPGGLLRAWLDTLVAALRIRNSVRHFSLRTLIVKPAVRRVRSAQARFAHRATSRRPRRLSASAGWFAFGAR